MKTCSACGISKIESEFYRHPNTSDGFMTQCKVCIADHGREYRKTDRAKELSKLKTQRIKHRVKTDPVFAEKFRAMKRKSMRNWYSKNKEKFRIFHARWTEKRRSLRPPKPTCDVCGNTQDFRLFKGVWICRVCASKNRKSKSRERNRISQLKERMAKLVTAYGAIAAERYFQYASTHKGCGTLGPLRIHNLCLPTDWQKSPPNTLQRIYLLNRITKSPFGNIGWSCQKCGLQCSEPRFFDIDHVHPRHKGGHSRIENLQVLCPNCHRKKTVFDVASKSIQMFLLKLPENTLVQKTV